ncbi:MAG: sigma-54-dependent Fis family transcriptional regulator, partial [Candidatus Aminicenantes bacterium]|nr:sigma-54-dependent Fis family transcriptional regulator [Candidatus Aminicenantes bacterium]
MNILVISESSELFQHLESILAPRGHTIIHTSRRDHFQTLVLKWGIRTVILKMDMADENGMTTLRDVRNFDPLIDVVLAGPRLPIEKTIEAINLGAVDYLEEPFTTDDVLTVLARIQDKIDLRKQTFRLEKQLAEKFVFEGMLGRNAVMLEIFSLIERLAKFASPVLITGPTGTGKEMVARALHQLSPRREKKLVVCDCTSVPESLFESELFGYEKGAFTGADRPKTGLFKESDGGTLFLDEIGEIPVAVQTKLLRVLEEYRFRPLGSNSYVQIDVRVVCATNKNLRTLISEGRFREDLYHRINLAEIKLPELRDRKEDILLLANQFLETSNRKFKKNVRGISQRAKRVLQAYEYPGNVRELENLIERAVMLTTAPFVDLKDLPEALLRPGLEAGGIATEEGPYPYADLTLEEIERKHITEVLQAAGHNKVKAAKMLG